MKKLLIIMMSFVMLIGSVIPIIAEDEEAPSSIQEVFGEEISSTAKEGEISELITSFTVDKEQYFVIDIVSEKVSIEVSIYDSEHNYVDGIITDYDAETEIGLATLVFPLVAGKYTIEVKGIIGEGTYSYVLDKNDTIEVSNEEGIINANSYIPKEELLMNSDEQPAVFAPPNFDIAPGVKEFYEMYIGELYPIGYYSFPAPTYSSDNESVAIVNDVGEITAVGAGYATITYATLSDTYAINIMVSHVKLRAPGKELNIEGQDNDHITSVHIKEKFKLELSGAGSGTTVYKSSDTSIATVNSSGLVTAVKPGTVFIIATRGAYADMIEVTVKKPEMSITDITVFAGNQFKIGIFGGSGKVTWKSSNTAILTVNSSGTITPVKKGTAKVTATINGYKISTNVEVKENSYTYAPSLNINDYSTVDVVQSKIYYSGTTLKVEAYVINPTKYKIQKLVKLDGFIYDRANYRLIADQKLSNVTVNLKAKSYKKITLSFKKGIIVKNLYLPYEGAYFVIYITGSYTR